MSEYRLKAIEKKTDHFRTPKKFGKLWIVTEIGPEKQTYFPKVQAIKNGRVRHPETNEKYEDIDSILYFHVIPVKPSPESELELLELEKERLEKELTNA